MLGHMAAAPLYYFGSSGLALVLVVVAVAVVVGVLRTGLDDVGWKYQVLATFD